MGIIIILIILAIINVGVFIYNDMDEILSLCIGIVAIVALCITPLFMFVRNVEYPELKSNYDMLQESILTMNSQDIKLAGLYSKLLEINGKISKNKAYKDNFWIGIFCSDKIGNLELLEISKED